MKRQRQILEVFGNDRELTLTKQEIIERSGITFYHDTSRNIGYILSRMIKSGKLIRTSKGVYKLGTMDKNTVPKNQIKINF